MAQLYKMSAGGKHANGKNERVMFRDPRQKTATGRISTRTAAETRNKLFKINSSKKNQKKLVTLNDSGVKTRQIKKAGQENLSDLVAFE